MRSLIQNGDLNHLSFAETARRDFGIDAIDYCSVSFRDHVSDEDYLGKLNRRAADQGVRQVLVMVDEEGHLAATDKAIREKAVDRHRRWIDAAAELGCRGIALRVSGAGEADQQMAWAIDSLQRLDEPAQKRNINLLVASDRDLGAQAEQLSTMIQKADSNRCASLAVFDVPHPNRVSPQRMQELMQRAKGVCVIVRGAVKPDSAEANYLKRMISLVVDAGYRGYVSLEFRGDQQQAVASIRSVQKLMDRFRGRGETKATAPQNGHVDSVDCVKRPGLPLLRKVWFATRRR